MERVKGRIYRAAATGVLAILCVTAARAADADRWWSHVKVLADDRLEGRSAGSRGHLEAARYVADQFERLGLEPAGLDGYLQPVRLRSRRLVERRSSLALVLNDRIDPVALGDEATVSMRIDPPPSVTAPLVFAGYGLTVPELQYDDLRGLDLRGKVALLLTGGPPHIPGPLLAHYQSVRWTFLRQAGAIGVIAIANPKSMDIPWERSAPAALQPSVTLADPAAADSAGQQVAMTVNPARAEKFFAGAGHTFAEILTLSNEGATLPRFQLPASIRATITTTTEDIESQNVVGLLPGTDPTLRSEYVVLSAHLDHLGVGAPVAGDRIYNGAMDNAAGIATLLEVASAVRDAGLTFRRSLVFLAATAEEKGLLGSRYFAVNPTIEAAGSLVANLNTDMFLPLFPLKSLMVLGLEESDLAADVERVARQLGVRVQSDPEPERNTFVRSDQYSFISRGVPALALKVGYERDSAEHEMVRRWRAERYHAPSDDVGQPIDFDAAADFNRLYLKVVEAVANRSNRPQWNAESPFRRFAGPAER